MDQISRYVSPDVILKARRKNAPPRNWDAAIICFRSLSGSMQVVNAFGAKPVLAKYLYGQDPSSESPSLYEASINGASVCIVTCCHWGGPNAAIMVEELSCLGCKYIIGNGCAGAIDLSLSQGDQAIATNALLTDGTSRAYDINNLAPDEGLIKLAYDAAAELGHNLKPVCAATVDALYRETTDLVDTWLEAGANIINMETSPFYAASKACGVKSIWIGHISDRLGQSWEDWYIDRTKMSEITAHICLNVVKKALGDNGNG